MIEQLEAQSNKFIQLMESGGYLHALSANGRVWRFYDPDLGGLGWKPIDMELHD